LALAAGAAVQPVDLQQLLQQQQQQQQQKRAGTERADVTDTEEQQQHQQQQGDGQGVLISLLIVPAECNFSGSRYDHKLIHNLWQQQQHVSGDMQAPLHQAGCHKQHHQQQPPQQQQQQRWWLLVDAAKACCSHPPDCSDCSVDMLALSYYKIFGHPTGEIIIRSIVGVTAGRNVVLFSDCSVDMLELSDKISEKIFGHPTGEVLVT
jgi:molybdenum cofactor sulfurtransferase